MAESGWGVGVLSSLTKSLDPVSAPLRGGQVNWGAAIRLWDDASNSPSRTALAGRVHLSDLAACAAPSERALRHGLPGQAGQ